MCRPCPGGSGLVVNGIRSFVTLQFSTTTWRAILDCGLALLFALRSRMLTMKLKDRKNNDIERLLATIKQSRSPD